MTLLRRFLVALTVGLMAGLGAVPAVAATAPAPDAISWYESSGLSVARSHAGEDLPNVSSNDLSSLTIGTPINAQAFTDSAGNLAASSFWVAPLFLDGEPVGTLATDFRAGESKNAKVTGEEYFATELTELTAEQRVVVEPALGGKDNLGAWFLVTSEGIVSPLDPVARSVLAGEVKLASFDEIRRELLGSDKDPVAANDSPAAPTGIGGHIIIYVIIALVVLLVLVGTLVWLRYDRGDADERTRERKKNDDGARLTTTDEVTVLELPQSGRDEARE
ncbi:MAG: hypothetical protein QM705_14040 [Ancrocorticia sp.]